MSKHNGTLSLERLQEILHYDPETGIFKWKVARGGRVKSGDVAGCVNRNGYCLIRIEKTNYRAHRLAWLYMSGVWPTKFIDHINGDRADNRFVNLREATKAQNGQNSRASWGKSVFRGVCWDTHMKKWRAMIRVNGKLHHLGFFKDEAKAAEVYQSAQRLFHPFAPDLDIFGQCSGQEQMTAR